MPGHHKKIIETLANVLKDTSISVMGEAMRVKRNVDLYGGGVSVTEKECREYIHFVSDILKKVGHIIAE